MKVRSTRLQTTQKIETTMYVGNLRCRVMDFSLSGVKFVTKQQVDKIIEAKIKINDEIIYEGSVKIVWSTESENCFIHGGQFVSKLVTPGTVEAYNLVSEFSIDLDKLIEPILSQNDRIKSILFDFQNILQSIRSLSLEFNNKIKIKSSNIHLSLDDAIKSIYLKTIHPKLIELSISLTREYDKIKTEEEMNSFSKALQSTIGVHLLEGQFGFRAHTKPLGYAGDYELMSQIYKNEPAGSNIFEKIMHCYAVNELSSESVRFRKKHIANMMYDILKSKNSLKILSIASGPASEIVEMLSAIEYDSQKKIDIYLLDGDINSLVEAKNNVDQISYMINPNISINYIHQNITDIISRKVLKKEIIKYQEFDFIYSMGLFDYLDDRIAKLLINEIAKYLKEDGQVVIGNFHKNSPTKAILDVVGEWRLKYRSEEEMLSLINKDYLSASIHFDPHKIEMFFCLRKL